MTALLRISVGIAVLALVGCGDTADVAGKVTFQGKPLVFGTVLVIGSDGVPKSGAIQPDGTYRVSGVKTGTARMTVSSPPPPGMTPAGKKPRGGREGTDDERIPADANSSVSPEVAKGWFPIPQKYAGPELSGLTAEVKAGHPVDIGLK